MPPHQRPRRRLQGKAKLVIRRASALDEREKARPGNDFEVNE